MLMRDIMDLIDPNKMDTKTMIAILKGLNRNLSEYQPYTASDVVNHYGRHYETAVDAANLRKIIAQIARLDAQSRRDIAAAISLND